MKKLITILLIVVLAGGTGLTACSASTGKTKTETAEAGTEVKAAADGEVYTVYEDPQMGTTVVIRHEDGYTTHYASLAEEVFVSAGDKVELGDAIGTVGCSALMESALPDHVCFSVTRDGETADPAEFLN